MRYFFIFGLLLALGRGKPIESSLASPAAITISVAVPQASDQSLPSVTTEQPQISNSTESRTWTTALFNTSDPGRALQNVNITNSDNPIVMTTDDFETLTSRAKEYFIRHNPNVPIVGFYSIFAMLPPVFPPSAPPPSSAASGPQPSNPSQPGSNAEQIAVFTLTIAVYDPSTSTPSWPSYTLYEISTYSVDDYHFTTSSTSPWLFPSPSLLFDSDDLVVTLRTALRIATRKNMPAARKNVIELSRRTRGSMPRGDFNQAEPLYQFEDHPPPSGPSGQPPSPGLWPRAPYSIVGAQLGTYVDVGVGDGISAGNSSSNSGEGGEGGKGGNGTIVN